MTENYGCMAKLAIGIARLMPARSFLVVFTLEAAAAVNIVTTLALSPPTGSGHRHAGLLLAALFFAIAAFATSGLESVLSVIEEAARKASDAETEKMRQNSAESNMHELFRALILSGVYTVLAIAQTILQAVQ